LDGAGDGGVDVGCGGLDVCAVASVVFSALYMRMQGQLGIIRERWDLKGKEIPHPLRIICDDFARRDYTARSRTSRALLGTHVEVAVEVDAAF
jgi:hypothetical protein